MKKVYIVPASNLHQFTHLVYKVVYNLPEANDGNDVVLMHTAEKRQWDGEEIIFVGFNLLPPLSWDEVYGIERDEAERLFGQLQAKGENVTWVEV